MSFFSCILLKKKGKIIYKSTERGDTHGKESGSKGSGKGTGEEDSEETSKGRSKEEVIPASFTPARTGIRGGGERPLPGVCGLYRDTRPGHRWVTRSDCTDPSVHDDPGSRHKTGQIGTEPQDISHLEPQCGKSTFESKAEPPSFPYLKTFRDSLPHRWPICTTGKDCSWP